MGDVFLLRDKIFPTVTSRNPGKVRSKPRRLLAGSQSEASRYSGSHRSIHIHPPLPIGAIHQQDDGPSPYSQIENSPSRKFTRYRQLLAGRIFMESQEVRRVALFHFSANLFASYSTAAFSYLLLQSIC